MLRVAIVGAGRIGAKRAREVARSPGCRLVAIVDQDASRAQALALPYSCQAGADWETVVGSPHVDAVVVATTHRWLAPISLAALENHKHVLCEKPLALTAESADTLVAAASRFGVVLKTGFNHRHHPAIAGAHERFAQGEIGRLLFMRCRYGHGGRPGYEKEWRSDPAESGGGELLDQGIHAIDLFRWFGGDFPEVYATTSCSFWPIRVEDNVFCLLRTPTGEAASLHASWTQWKNLFSFEVFGEAGYLLVDGLGGSYGLERLTVGRRRAGSGAPQEQHFQFDAKDVSWAREWQEFISAIREARQPLASGVDGWQALRVVRAAYQSARTGLPVRLVEEERCKTMATSAVSLMAFAR